MENLYLEPTPIYVNNNRKVLDNILLNSTISCEYQIFYSNTKRKRAHYFRAQYVYFNIQTAYTFTYIYAYYTYTSRDHTYLISDKYCLYFYIHFVQPTHEFSFHSKILVVFFILLLFICGYVCVCCELYERRKAKQTRN